MVSIDVRMLHDDRLQSGKRLATTIDDSIGAGEEGLPIHIRGNHRAIDGNHRALDHGARIDNRHRQMSEFLVNRIGTQHERTRGMAIIQNQLTILTQREVAGEIRQHPSPWVIAGESEV